MEPNEKIVDTSKIKNKIVEKLQQCMIKFQIGRKHNIENFNIDKKDPHNLQPSVISHPPKNYSLDIKNYVIPMYSDSKTTKPKIRRISNLDSLNRESMKLMESKKYLVKDIQSYLKHLPKLDIKQETKKHSTFRQSNGMNNFYSTSRATTSSEKFRQGSQNAINRFNLDNNIAVSNDKVMASERQKTLNKSKSHSNFMQLTPAERKDKERRDYLANLKSQTKMMTNRSRLDNESTQFNTARDGPTYRTNEPISYRTNGYASNRKSISKVEFDQTEDYVDENESEEEEFQSYLRDDYKTDQPTDPKYESTYTKRLVHQTRINEYTNSYKAEGILEDVNQIENKIKSCVNDLRQNSFYKLIVNKKVEGKNQITDRLKKVASVYSEMNDKDLLYDKFYNEIDSRIKQMHNQELHKKNFSQVMSFQKGIEKIWDFATQDIKRTKSMFKVFYRPESHQENLRLDESYKSLYNDLVFHKRYANHYDFQHKNETFSVQPTTAYSREHSKYMFDLVKCSSFNHMVKEFRDVIKTEDKDLNKLIRLLEYDRLLVYEQDHYGHTLLHWCCKRNLTQLAYNLITQYNVIIDPVDHFGYTPLFYAVKHHFLDLAKLLLYSCASMMIRRNGVFEHILLVCKEEAELADLKKDIRRYIMLCMTKWDDQKSVSIMNRYGWVYRKEIFKEDFRSLLFHRSDKCVKYDYKYFNNY